MSPLHKIHNRFFFLVACGSVSAAQACGPFFPNQVIAGGSENLLRIPDGRFAIELQALDGGQAPAFKAGASDSAKVDEEELSAVLTKDGKPNTVLIEQYAQVRKLIADHASALEKAVESTEFHRPPPMQNVDVPAGLPFEFDLYLRGLIAFHRDDSAAAQKIWKDLLALPIEQRRHRSTWAAFMLGKSYMKSDPALAIEHFKQTRAFASDGLDDALGLASSSLGWEAKVELDGGHPVQAIQLYLLQRWTGDRLAAESLRECADRALSGRPDTLVAAAGDSDARRVVTAFLICNAGPFHALSKEEIRRIPVWLSAVESAAVKDMPGADRLAWLAYNSGDCAQADRWVARSPADSAVANWVRAKLLLRGGKTDEAASVLVKIVRSFPQTDFPTEHEYDGNNDSPQTIPRSITTDLGVLQLGRGQYTDSMRLLMLADHWRDAAYIAERVLTTDELQAFVDRFCPPVKMPRDQNQGARVPAWNESSRVLRLLLARRLTRQGDWKIARGYFTEELRPKLDQYIEGIRDGHDKTKSDADRAAGYRTAARIACKDGINLLATELAPDFYWYGGSFEFDDEKARLAQKGIAAPTADELARFKETEPDDNRRWHYRYIAADYAWDAAELMPDDDEQTAAWLYESGSWLKARDPKLADKYYKALVRRCPDTALGKKAAELHWFPLTQH